MFVRGSLVAPLVATLFAVAALPGCDGKGKTGAASPPSSTASAKPAAASATSSAAPKESAVAALKAGDAAPDVEMTLQDGRKVKLASLKGSAVAIYFYP